MFGGMRITNAVLLASGLALACSSGSSGESDSPAPAQPDKAPAVEPVRVLVTGFNDWRELGDPPNVWRCRDNPSCRLLLGGPQTQAPREFAGPLVTRLEAAAPEVEWRFATMPVTWGAFADVPTDVDVIVNIGLGVYDRFDALQLESGAYNLRQGADAVAVEQPGPIVEGAEPTLEPPASSPIVGRLEQLAGQTLAGYEVVVARAREQNSYLCNETHFHALSALARGQGRLREVYFLHIPYAKDDDYDALADGVAALVLNLVGGDTLAP